MKLLVHIDQRAAIAAGIDAPSSTARVDFNPANVRARDILRLVSEFINVRTGEVELPGGLRPTFLSAPRDTSEIEPELVSCLWKVAEREDAPDWLRERRARAVEATAEVINERRVRPSDATAEVTRNRRGEIERRVDRSSHDLIDGEFRMGRTDPEPVGRVRFHEDEPDWPADPYPPMLTGPAAEQWLAEIEADNKEAATRALEEAERLFLEKERWQDEERARAEREADEESAREKARLQRYSAWLREHGTAMARERLTRGWLTANDIFPMIVLAELRETRYPLLEVQPDEETYRERPARSDAEMEAILGIEKQLKDLGMKPLSVSVGENAVWDAERTEIRANLLWPQYPEEKTFWLSFSGTARSDAEMARFDLARLIAPETAPRAGAPKKPTKTPKTPRDKGAIERARQSKMNKQSSLLPARPGRR